MLWIRLKYRIKLLLNTLLFNIGFGKLLLKNRYGERILVFHGIDKVGETKYNSRFISKTYFETFIKHISTHYNIISLDDFYAKKFKPNTLNIALTFDDGYLNNFKYAVPILEKYNIPASFYITTIHEKANFLWADFLDIVSFHSKKETINFKGKTYVKNGKNEFINNGISLKKLAKTLPYEDIESLYEIFKLEWNCLPLKKLEDYWKLMSSEQIKAISDHPFFTIGAHGETHTNLKKINYSTANAEIKQSKLVLETICKTTVNEFAFPFGYYSSETIDYCKAIGFKKILLVDYENEDYKKDNIVKNRFVINPYITLEQQISYLLKGTYI
tara:strand:+ start:173 stop:1159 length:987 start_codon:yes stop_codon:yes gene_type:complete